MERHFLGGLVAADELAARVETGQAGGVEAAKGRASGGYEETAVCGTRGYVSCAAAREATVEHGFRQKADLVAEVCFAHASPDSTAAALAK